MGIEEELDRKLTDEKKTQLIQRVTESVNDGVLNIRDWMAIYEILLEAHRRAEAEIAERILEESLRGDAEC